MAVALINNHSGKVGINVWSKLAEEKEYRWAKRLVYTVSNVLNLFTVQNGNVNGMPVDVWGGIEVTEQSTLSVKDLLYTDTWYFDTFWSIDTGFVVADNGEIYTSVQLMRDISAGHKLTQVTNGETEYVTSTNPAKYPDGEIRQEVDMFDERKGYYYKKIEEG